MSLHTKDDLERALKIMGVQTALIQQHKDRQNEFFIEVPCEYRNIVQEFFKLNSPADVHWVIKTNDHLVAEDGIMWESIEHSKPKEKPPIFALLGKGVLLGSTCVQPIELQDPPQKVVREALRSVPAKSKINVLYLDVNDELPAQIPEGFTVALPRKCSEYPDLWKQTVRMALVDGTDKKVFGFAHSKTLGTIMKGIVEDTEILEKAWDGIVETTGYTLAYSDFLLRNNICPLKIHGDRRWSHTGSTPPNTLAAWLEYDVVNLAGIPPLERACEKRAWHLYQLQSIYAVVTAYLYVVDSNALKPLDTALSYKINAEFKCLIEDLIATGELPKVDAYVDHLGQLVTKNWWSPLAEDATFMLDIHEVKWIKKQLETQLFND
ncbi:hypothetical protein GR11A_00138 [Vibrio phage vB_VcorM_GR11A]|nr:hypothetical protein GR11A_00138 [Vibrio phage vB_VcorM_GR11A]